MKQRITSIDALDILEIIGRRHIEVRFGAHSFVEAQGGIHFLCKKKPRLKWNKIRITRQGRTWKEDGIYKVDLIKRNFEECIDYLYKSIELPFIKSSLREYVLTNLFTQI